nr:cysteine proteinase [Quercus suber]
MQYGVVAEKIYGFVGKTQIYGNRPQGTPFARITDYTVIDPINEELMIEMLQKDICLCTSIYLFYEIKEYKNGPDSIYEGASGERMDNSHILHSVVITGCGITPNTRKRFWLIKNSWGKGWGDDGLGRISRGSSAYNPDTGRRDLNLLHCVIACGGIKAMTS